MQQMWNTPTYVMLWVLNFCLKLSLAIPIGKSYRIRAQMSINFQMNLWRRRMKDGTYHYGLEMTTPLGQRRGESGTDCEWPACGWGADNVHQNPSYPWGTL